MSNFKIVLFTVVVYLSALLLATSLAEKSEAHEAVMISDQTYTDLVFPLCVAEVANLLSNSDVPTTAEEVTELEISCFRGKMDTTYPLKYIEHKHAEVTQ